MRWLASSLVAGFGAYLVYAYGTGVARVLHPPHLRRAYRPDRYRAHGGAAPRGARARRAAVRPSRLSALLWVIPVAVAVLLPARPLGISTAAQRGVDALPLGRLEDFPEFRVAVRSETLTIKDWVRALQTDPEPERIAGSRCG